MKKLIYLLLLSGVFVFCACKSDGKKSGAEGDDAQQTGDTKVKSGNACDQYLADYGEWVVDYIKFLGKMKENPTDMELASKALEYADDALKFADDYGTLGDCATNADFLAKYMELAQKISDAAAAMYQQ